MKQPQVPDAWSGVYLGLWILWLAAAAWFGFMGDVQQREYWWWIAGGFGVLELIGGLAYRDKLPMLTQVFGRYVPAEILFIVLAIGCWRLSRWVPGWIVWPGCAWQVVHFLKHYHSYQKAHPSDQ
jgi:hypothetical protein